MGQVLHIEHDEAHALAVELATLTGESIDAAVIASLRARLGRERDVRRRTFEMLAASDEFRALLVDLPPSSNHDWLYDEQTGLPK